jgi:hypothetical protein
MAPTIGLDIVTTTGGGASPLMIVAILVMLALVLAIVCDPKAAQR